MKNIKNVIEVRKRVKRDLSAASIPNWLICQPLSNISYIARVLLARLYMWADSNDECHRSAKQLAAEMGISPRSVERHIKELKDLKLINTFQIEEGGINHFYFLQHPWEDTILPPGLDYFGDLPSVQVVGTPPSRVAVLKEERKRSSNTFKGLRESDVPLEEIVAIYHELLPDNPKIRVIDPALKNQLTKMIKNWPQYSTSGKSFSLDGFRQLLNVIISTQPGFVRPYVTKEGKTHMNSLRNITRESNLARIINGEFNFK